MKKLVIFFALFAFSGSVLAQDQEKPYEFGSTLVTVSAFNFDDRLSGDDRVPQVLNGLFFRYQKKRLGYRALISYSRRPVSVVDEYKGLTYPVSFEKRHDLGLGVGLQQDLLKNKKWLYASLDLLYRRIDAEGFLFLWLTRSYRSIEHSANCFLGAGFKIPLGKYLLLSPELGANGSYFVNKTVYSYADWYQQVNSKEIIVSDFRLNPYVRLHLTVKF